MTADGTLVGAPAPYLCCTVCYNWPCDDARVNLEGVVWPRYTLCKSQYLLRWYVLFGTKLMVTPRLFGQWDSFFDLFYDLSGSFDSLKSVCCACWRSGVPSSYPGPSDMTRYTCCALGGYGSVQSCQACARDGYWNPPPCTSLWGSISAPGPFRAFFLDHSPPVPVFAPAQQSGVPSRHAEESGPSFAPSL